MIETPCSIKGYCINKYKANDSKYELCAYYAMPKASDSKMFEYVSILDAVNQLDSDTISRCKIHFEKLECAFGGYYINTEFYIDDQPIKNMKSSLCGKLGLVQDYSGNGLDIFNPEHLNNELSDFRQMIEYLTQAGLYLIQVYLQGYIQNIIDPNDDLCQELIELVKSVPEGKMLKPTYLTWEDYKNNNNDSKKTVIGSCNEVNKEKQSKADQSLSIQNSNVKIIPDNIQDYGSESYSKSTEDSSEYLENSGFIPNIITPSSLVKQEKHYTALLDIPLIVPM